MKDGHHTCAAPSCNREIPNAYLMCGPHWKSLPFHLRQKVNVAWSNVSRDQQSYLDAKGEAVLHVQKNEAAAAQGKMF